MLQTNHFTNNISFGKHVFSNAEERLPAASEVKIGEKIDYPDKQWNGENV